jgi:hypothetical protein
VICPPLVLELALACIPYFSEMQELWRLTNDLPAYLTTAAAWLSNVEIDRNDMADYTEKVLLFWRSLSPGSTLRHQISTLARHYPDTPTLRHQCQSTLGPTLRHQCQASVKPS